jgi:hypothetical protein
VPARSYSVGGSLSPCGANCAQKPVGKAGLPEHLAIASQAGDSDRERLRQTSKPGEGRAPVPSGELEPGDGDVAAIPADDLPGEGVGLGRPGDSQLIMSRPNNAERIPARAWGTAPGGAGSAWMPVTAGCWTAHGGCDPSADPSPAERVRRLERREGEAALLEVSLASLFALVLRVLPALATTLGRADTRGRGPLSRPSQPPEG